jgi:hypothetical protein
VRARAARDRVAPLRETALLALVDLLATADQADELDYYDAATSAERAEFDRGLMAHAAMTNPYVAELIAAAREVIAMGGAAANVLRPKVSPLIAD